MLFRDIAHSGIELRASYRKDEDRVTAQLTLESRRPLRYTRHLQSRLRIGREAIFDRHATEADFFTDPKEERYANIIHAVGDPRARFSVSAMLSYKRVAD